VQIVVHGDCTRDDIQRMIAYQDEVVSRHGYVLLLVDLRDSKGLDGAARRLGADWGKANAKRYAVAMWGASRMARTLGTLLHSAVVMLSGQRTRQDFFDTESEARAWLDKQRAVLRGFIATG